MASEPKKHYIFTGAPNLTELQLVCIQAEEPNFSRRIIELTKGAKVYALELVRVQKDGNTYFLLQSRNVE